MTQQRPICTNELIHSIAKTELNNFKIKLLLINPYNPTPLDNIYTYH